jgi:hypothetical protein
MYTPEVKALARKLYVQLRDINEVALALKKEGYNVTVSTVKRWKKVQRFDEAAQEYDRRLAEYDGLLLGLDREMFLELLQTRKELRDQIKENPGDSQLVYSYLGTVKLILELQNKNLGGGSDAEIVDKVIEIFTGDPVIGPVLQSRKAEVLKILAKWKKQK